MRINLKKAMLKCMLLVLLFQNGIINNSLGVIGLFIKYFDEIITCCFIVYIFVQIFIFKERLIEFEKGISLCCFCLLLIGTISSIYNHIQPLFPSVIDALTCSKFMIVLLGSSIMWRNSKYRSNIIKELNGIIRLVGVILFILVIVNVFFVQVFPVYDFRIFMNSQGLFFALPADLAIVSLCGIVILFYNSKFYKHNIIFAVIYTLVGISTMRYKEIGAIILTWLLYIYFIKGKFRSKIIILICATIVVCLFGQTQFNKYYRDENSGRNLLTKYSIMIANEYFPLGAGFATYGSNMSNEYYSPIYYKYGFNNIWGLSPEDSSYILDTFFPVVLGEFGWFGLTVIIYFFYRLLKEALIIKNQYLLNSALSLICYIIISALGTTSIFNPICMFMAISLGNIFALSKDEQI